MPDVKKKRILLVEDEPLIALAKRRMLESAGYDVGVAHSGEQALERFTDSPIPDLILMDIDLGHGIDGTETAHRILEDHNVPIVFLSSHAEPEIVARTEKITSYGYVQKTTEDPILLASIRMAFQLWEAHQKIVESESLQANLFEQVPGAIYQFRFFPDGSSCFPMASRNIWLVYEVTPEEVREDATPAFQRIHPDDFDAVVASITRSYETLEDWEDDYRVILPSRGERWLRGRAKPEQLADGSVLWHGYITDITDYKTTESRSSVQHRIIEAIQDAVIVTDSTGIITYHNSAAAGLYQFPPDSAVGTSISNVIPCGRNSDNARVHNPLCAIADHAQWTGEQLIEPADGKVFTVSISNYPIVDTRGELEAIVSVSRRLHYGTPFRTAKTDAHYLENELFELIQRDSEIFTFLREGSLDGMWYWDTEKPEHEWMDNRFWELLGYDPATKRHDPAEWQDLIHPDDLKVALENFHKHLEDPDHPYDQVVRYTHKNGGTVYVRCRGLAIRDENGKPRRMLGVHNDITELMTTIETEKMLRHELNHRVKNNLAIVQSLISLKQSEEGGTADLSDILHQVDTVRVLHEQLQGSDELTTLELDPYLRSILASVFDSAVHVEVSGLNVEVTSKVAVPLGLVINELATNAAKHAFSATEEPRFTVNISKSNEADNRVGVSVSNTGPPFPAHVDLDNAASLGMRLISSLVDQLESTLVLTREPHPVFKFDVEYENLFDSQMKRA